MVRFDLHIHSDNSDGTDSVHELIRKITEEGLKLVALTDHDTVSGISEMKNGLPDNIKFLPGIELSCKAKGFDCHILGYNIDENSPSLLDLIKKGKQLRRTKLETRINHLKNEWNIELSKDESDFLYAQNSVGKPHIAEILVNRGLAENTTQAIQKYIEGCKTGDSRFDTVEAIDVIKQAGGTPVWAHPLGGENEKRPSEEEFLSKLKIMIECGIQGLECFYSQYSDSEISFLRECANKNGLFITGGSDYHGTNKPVLLGQVNTNNEPVDSEELNLPIF